MKPVILLVDDETMLREVMGDVLLGDGFVCVPCGNGADAIRLIEGKLYNFDLLLSDVVMPGTVNGFEVADRFQRAFPNAGVILLSGYLDDKGAASLSKGRMLVMAKPVRLEPLLAAVKEAVQAHS